MFTLCDREMPLDDIKCPQFVDFCTQDPFELNDGADFCFGIRLKLILKVIYILKRNK